MVGGVGFIEARQSWRFESAVGLHETSTTIMKRIIKEFLKSHADYQEQAARYAAYKSLPWWKKIFAKEVERPYGSSRFMAVPLYDTFGMRIELRMYYCNSKVEFSVAVNEAGRGYKVDVATSEVESLIGAKSRRISPKAEVLVGKCLAYSKNLIAEAQIFTN